MSSTKNEEKQPDPLEKTEELFNFLQGVVPSGYSVLHPPNLSADQAWTVLWFIQNQYFQFPDHIERCDVCGRLYNSDAEGDVLDYGEPPHSFCDSCTYSPIYATKSATESDPVK